MKAFPMVHPTEDCKFIDAGMDLRDYFAAKAMQAAISRTDTPTTFNAKETALTAYKIADAMMKVREE